MLVQITPYNHDIVILAQSMFCIPTLEPQDTIEDSTDKICRVGGINKTNLLLAPSNSFWNQQHQNTGINDASDTSKIQSDVRDFEKQGETTIPLAILTRLVWKIFANETISELIMMNLMMTLLDP